MDRTPTPPTVYKRLLLRLDWVLYRGLFDVVIAVHVEDGPDTLVPTTL